MDSWVYRRLTKEALRGSPARLIDCTDAGIARLLCSSAMADGTVLINVTGRAIPSILRSRTLWTTQHSPPLLRGTKISKIDRSKQMDVDARTRRRLCELNARSDQSMN